MPRPRKQIPVGTVINMLTVLGVGDPVPMGKWLRSTSVVRCECGTVKTIPNNVLLAGKTKSCGCFLAVAIGLRAKKHGMSVGEWVSEYTSWINMMYRCFNPSNSQYSRYGGRGISVCERWLCVENFVEDMGHKPSVCHTLDRIDNSKGYSPENCRWADKKTQAENRRSSRMYTVDGITRCRKGWAEAWGVSRYIAGKKLEAMRCTA